jgi:hypothetical protein
MLPMLLLLPLAGGCVQRTLNITSNPPGALVYLNDQEVGRTPVSRDFTWYGTYDVQLRKEGYQTLDTKMSLVAPAWLWPPIDLLAELAPWHIKDIRNESFVMPPASTQQADPDAMVTRADEMKAKLQSSQYTRSPTTRPATPK